MKSSYPLRRQVFRSPCSFCARGLDFETIRLPANYGCTPRTRQHLRELNGWLRRVRSSSTLPLLESHDVHSIPDYIDVSANSKFPSSRSCTLFNSLVRPVRSETCMHLAFGKDSPQMALVAKWIPNLRCNGEDARKQTRMALEGSRQEGRAEMVQCKDIKTLCSFLFEHSSTASNSSLAHTAQSSLQHLP